MNLVKEIIEESAFEDLTLRKSSEAGETSVVVVDFAKGHCKPCQKTAPLFENLAIKYDGQAIFAKVDADSCPEAKLLLKKLGIKSVPTFQIWVDGSKVDTIQGAHMDELEESIQSTLAKLKIKV